MKFFRKIAAAALSAALIFGSAALPEGNALNVTVSAASKLSAPEGIKVTAGEDSVVIRWDKVSGADGYRVYMHSEETDEYEKYKNVTGTKCTVKDLKSGTKYKFKVAALVKNGEKYSVQTKSGKIEVKTKSGLLSAPKNIRASSDETSVTLRWDAVDGADAYRVYKYSSSQKKYKSFKTVRKTSCKMTDMKSGTTYKFKVAALVKSGDSYKAQELSGKITVKTAEKSDDGTLKELVQPKFGDRIENVRKTSKVSNWTDMTDDEDEDDHYTYGGEAVYSGRDSVVFFSFNSGGELYAYSIFIPTSISEYNAIVDRLKSSLMGDYSYIDGFHVWIIGTLGVTVSYYYDDNKTVVMFMDNAYAVSEDSGTSM